MCDATAEWTRHTQFAGDHPYCDEHARLESDFDDMDDSYAFWSSRKERQEKLRNIIAGVKATVDDEVGYEESTHEKQAEFARKRNYDYKD
jgi:hypothetical protein